MATLSKYNRELNEMCEGKCSVPMWRGGLPAGFCDDPAYGNETENHKEWMRMKREYQYVPALACPGHGGPRKKEMVNLCVNCKEHIATCDSNPEFGTGVGNDNVYECDNFIK